MQDKVTIRVKLDKKLWQKIRAKGLLEDKNVAEVVEEALIKILEARDGK